MDCLFSSSSEQWEFFLAKSNQHSDSPSSIDVLGPVTSSVGIPSLLPKPNRQTSVQIPNERELPPLVANSHLSPFSLNWRSGSIPTSPSPERKPAPIEQPIDKHSASVSSRVANNAGSLLDQYYAQNGRKSSPTQTLILSHSSGTETPLGIPRRALAVQNQTAYFPTPEKAKSTREIHVPFDEAAEGSMSGSPPERDEDQQSVHLPHSAIRHVQRPITFELHSPEVQPAIWSHAKSVISAPNGPIGKLSPLDDNKGVRAKLSRHLPNVFSEGEPRSPADSDCSDCSDISSAQSPKASVPERLYGSQVRR